MHLVEELQEKVTDFRFSIILFNDVQESVFTLDEWKNDWTLAQVYEVRELHSSTTQNIFFYKPVL